jgi:hypothetical protein
VVNRTTIPESVTTAVSPENQKNSAAPEEGRGMSRARPNRAAAATLHDAGEPPPLEIQKPAARRALR